MKLNRTHFNILLFLTLIFIALVFTQCKSSTKYNNKFLSPKRHEQSRGKKVTSTNGAAAVELTALIRKLYKWHEADKMKHEGFKPLKSNPSDTLYSGIDMDENAKAINELKETGLFASSFLNDYHQIAIRMNNELRDGSSLWPEGELSTFGDDADSWCNCQDFPIDNYWTIITLTDIKINNTEANFKWTWGDKFYYKAGATKKDGTWKVSYLQGFDMNSYSWRWWEKNKKTNQ